MRYYLCLLISSCILFGCHGKSSSTNGDTKAANSSRHNLSSLKPLKTGVVIDSVICIEDSSQIYSIYLPSKYDTTKNWPIIYFFDPHGCGNLPVKLYKDLAEKYGFIIAGTYNSKNGMQFDAASQAAQVFMKDTWMRLSEDNNRLYTSGFSGGASVASLVAITNGGIAGVVACGGGLPDNAPQPKNPFSFISFVGDKDFHLMPLHQMDKMLDSTSMSHQLIVFNGKHQWPPALVYEQAFQWLDMDAMRMKTLAKNDSIIKSIREKFLNEAEEWHKKRNIAQEYFTYKKMLNYLRDLDDMGKIAAKVQDFENSEVLEKYLKDEETFEAEEAQEILEFRVQMPKMDKAWWDTKIATMQKMLKRDTSSPAALQTQRILGYLSLSIYMTASRALNQRNYSAATYFNDLYAKVDPTNPEHCYISANMAMTSNNSTKALTDLKEAVKLGFVDSKRLEQDSYFTSLHNSSEYKQLLKEMAAKPDKIDLTQ